MVGSTPLQGVVGDHAWNHVVCHSTVLPLKCSTASSPQGRVGLAAREPYQGNVWAPLVGCDLAYHRHTCLLHLVYYKVGPLVGYNVFQDPVFV